MNGNRRTGLGTFAVAMMAGATFFALPCLGAQDSVRAGSRMQLQPMQIQPVQSRPTQPQPMRFQSIQMQQAPRPQPQFQQTQVLTSLNLATVANANGASVGSSERFGPVTPSATSVSVLSPQRIPFERPIVLNQSAVVGPFQSSPWGSGSAGSPPGSGIPLPKDPTGGRGDVSTGLPNTSPWGGGGPGTPDLGDGIMGVHDQGETPKTNYGEGIPDPRQGPGQKTAGHGWGKDQYGQPIFKTPGGKDEKDDLGREDKYGPFSKGVGGPGFWFGYASTHAKMGIWDGIVSQGGTPQFTVGGGGNPESGWWKEAVTHDDGTTVTTTWAKDGSSTKVTKKGTVVTTTTNDKEGNLTGSTTEDTASWCDDENRILEFLGAGGYPRPEEGGDGKPTNKSEMTLLLLSASKALPTSGDEPRGNPLVSDPTPMKNGKAANEGHGSSAAQGGDLAAAGAAKAESAWRFSGKKPGSEVTDPAEWQSHKTSDFSLARIKHFEIIDPSEAQAIESALAKSSAASGSAAANRSAKVASVGAGVQKLASQNGQRGWAPLNAGDDVTSGGLIRVKNTGGATVRFARSASPMKWSVVSSNATHIVYQVESAK